MAYFLDNCRFNPAAGGTTDWVYSSVVTGSQSPAAAGAVNGRLYKVLSISADKSQWEISEGAYTSASGTFARTTVLYNSAGTGTASGQSGAGTKINFAAAPQVAVVAIAEDMVPQTQGHIPGETGTGTAASGEVGELVGPSTVTTGTLTSGTATNITSITVPAGDFIIHGGYSASGSGGPSVTDIWVSINTVTATGVNTAGQSFRVRGMTLSDPVAAGDLGQLQVSNSAPTTYYMNTTCVYSGGTFAVTGKLWAERRR